MKRVLILANHTIVIYAFRRELVHKLLELGYSVTIALPYNDDAKYFEKLGCKVVDTPLERRNKNVFKDALLIKSYYKLMKSVKPDIIFSYTIKPNIYGAAVARLLKIPTVVNITGLGSAIVTPGILQTFVSVLCKVSFRKVQTIFFQNIDNMKFFEKNRIALGKHKLLPGSGVNLDHFKLLEYPDKETLDFVFISRIMREKGIDHYLEAAQYIREKYPFTRFHVCGFCEEEYEDVLANFQNRSIIEYHGKVKDVREVFKFTHCVVHPTYHEGMSNILLEAAACGRPVIASDIPGCREIFDEGLSGLGFEPKNTGSLIKAIENFIHLDNDERVTMGARGRVKVSEEFDRKIVVKAYLEELRTIGG